MVENSARNPNLIPIEEGKANQLHEMFIFRRRLRWKRQSLSDRRTKERKKERQKERKKEKKEERKKERKMWHVNSFFKTVKMQHRSSLTCVISRLVVQIRGTRFLCAF